MNNEEDNNATTGPTSPGESPQGGNDQGLNASPTVMDSDTEKSEHVPPIIIRRGSFILDVDRTLLATPLSNPPLPHTFQYQHPLPFLMRGIRYMASPFGIQESMYYSPNPVGYRVEMYFAGLAELLRFVVFTRTDGNGVDRLWVASNIPLPVVIGSGDPDRPLRYLHPDPGGGELRLDRVAVVDSANQNLFQVTRAQDPFSLSEYRMAIWRQH